MKTFKEVCKDVGLIPLEIYNNDRNAIGYSCIHKFTDGSRKFRINELDDEFIFMATKPYCRYFHGLKIFKTLKEAEDFIFTSECGDLLDEKL